MAGGKGEEGDITPIHGFCYGIAETAYIASSKAFWTDFVSQKWSD